MSETQSLKTQPNQKRYVAADAMISTIFAANTDKDLAAKGIIESTARSYRHRHKNNNLDLNAQRNMLRALGYEDMQLTVNPAARKK